MSITFTMTAAYRDVMVENLNCYKDHPLMWGVLGRRRKRDEHPIVLAGLLRAWPADADGMVRCRFNDLEGTLTWRASAIGQVLDDIDISQSDLPAWLGVSVVPAYDYVRHHMRPRYLEVVVGCRHSEDCRQWTEAIKWVLAFGDKKPAPTDHNFGRRLTVQSKLYNALFCATHGQDPTPSTMLSWWPRPTWLFFTPAPDPIVTYLHPADDAALEALSA